MTLPAFLAAPLSNKKPAPSFQVTSLTGVEFDSISLRGKVVVLNFWFIGCGPCKAEIPGLNKLVEEFSNKDVVFLAFALDNSEDLKKFLKETPFEYQIIPDAKQIAKQYGVRAYPKHVIINKDGQIDSVQRGGGKNRYNTLRPLILRLLNEKAADDPRPRLITCSAAKA